MSRQIQVNSRGDCDGAVTASARQTSVAGREQNAAQRSDRQPEPLAANTPVSRARPSPVLRVGVARETTNTLGLQTMEQLIKLTSARIESRLHIIYPFLNP